MSGGQKWHDETPAGFVFSVKASRYCTNRRELAAAGESIERFAGQGLAELGERLGPVNWQFMETKKFDAEDMDAFLTLLPREVGGLPLRTALEVSHPSFPDPRFVELERRHKVALTSADHEHFPRRHDPPTDITFPPLMATRETDE